MDTRLTQNALQVLNNRYLIKNDEGTVIETPEQMWRRIADTISDSKELADKVYKLMCETKFLPNSPAFNAGTQIKNYSACFSLCVHDSMKSIFQTLAISAEIFQSGGGCGYNFSDVRPQGYPVKKTQGIASGPISFAHVYDAGIDTIKAGGKRRGAAIGLLSISHPDVLKWIHVKDEGSTMSNFNLSVVITDKFMDAVKNNEDWNLEFGGKISKTVKAKELFSEICEHAHKTGDPGIVFIDNINRFNCHKHIGMVQNVNPCVTGDTHVLTSDGYKQAGIIKVGDLIVTRNGDKLPVKKIEINGDMQIYTVHFDNNEEIKCTKSHQFLVTKPSWTNISNVYLPLSELEVGDKIKQYEGDYATITSIEKMSVHKTVYDIYEPTTDTWVTNNLISRGCGEINIFTGRCPADYTELNIKAGDDIAESCNLGSFDISKYVVDGKMNWQLLETDIHTAVEFLDCIPDKNRYVVPEIEKGTKLLRKIGLGMMGFADALALMNISYNSQEAIEFAEHLMEFINFHSTKSSIELAKVKCSFPAFKGSAWDTGEVWSFKNTTDRFDWNSLKESIKQYGIRNCNVNAIAPTGTLSIIAGCSSSLEPIIGVIFEKHIAMGILYETNQHFKKLMQQRGLWSPEIEKKCSRQASIQGIPEIPDDIKRLFMTSYDVPYQQHIKIQEAFQKYTDINISKTINMSNNVTIADVTAAYMLASHNCKGITIYRDGSKTEQVLVTGTTSKEVPTPRLRFRDHLGVAREIRTACGVFYNFITVDEFGIFEDFQINSRKGGCDASQKALGRATSMLLRHNVPVPTIVKQFHRVDCNACIIKKTTLHKDLENGIEISPEDMITIISCADGVSNHLSEYYNEKEILEKMILLQTSIHSKFNINHSGVDNLSKDAKPSSAKKHCPECGSDKVDNSKCGTCQECGFSKCL